MRISYFAKIRQAENGFVITFPDVPGCFTCAFTRDEIEPLSKEVLSLAFNGHDPRDLPVPSRMEEVELEEGQELVLIEAEMELSEGVLKSLIESDLM